MRIFRSLTLVLLACCLTLHAQAGNPERAGTSAAGELRIPVSARGIALGNGVMADVAGVEALYYNPAGISNVGGTELYFSHLSYIADMNKNYLGGVIKTGYGAFGISVDVFSVGDIEETTEESPEGTGRVFSPTFAVVGATYARFLTDAVSVGGTLKLIDESINDVSALGVAFDVGMQYQPGPKGLRFGLVLKDFGPQMKYTGEGFSSFHSVSDNPSANQHSLGSESASAELPSTFQAGVVYTPVNRADSKLEGYGSFVNNNFGRDEYQIGAEYTYHTILSLRGSYVTTGESTYNYGPAFGVGIRIPVNAGSAAQFDYAIRTVKNYFDDNQVFSVKFSF